MNRNKNTSLLVTGERDLERDQLRAEFDKFGHISRIFVDQLGRFAKVYYLDTESCYRAFCGLRDNQFDWKLDYREDKAEALQLENSLVTERAVKNPEMEDYSEEEFSETYDYCNVHGQPLVVLQGDSGDLYVNLKDIKNSGFALFRLDTFDITLSDANQIGKEFELHLLSEAKKYILKNRVVCIDEARILKTIENCKLKLLGDQRMQSPRVRPVQQLPEYSFDTAASNENKKQKDDSKHRSQSRGPGNRPQQTDYNRQQTDSNRYQQTDYNRHQQTDSNRHQQTDYNRHQQTDSGSQRHRPGGRGQNNQKNTNSNWGNQFQRGDEYSAGYSSNKNHNDRSQGRGKRQDPVDSPFVDLNDSFQSQKTQKSALNIAASSRQAQPRNVQPKQNMRNLGNNNDHKTAGSVSSASSSENRRIDFSDKVKKISLEIGNEYDVRVCFAEPNKDNICWVHERKSVDQMEELMINIFETEPKLEVIENPGRGELILGLFEDVWCRAVVLGKNRVQFIDYGNHGNIESCKALPENLQKVPALAARFVINRCTKKIVEDMEFKVVIDKKYDDDTYLVKILETDSLEVEIAKTSEKANTQVKNKENSPPVEEAKPALQIENEEISEKNKPDNTVEINNKVYFDIPKPINTLKNDDTVIISDVADRKFFLKTKECIDQAKKINSHIRELDKSDLELGNYKEGQLVLCRKEGMISLCRAVITEKQSSSIVCVQFIDYPGTDSLCTKSLRNVDQFLAEQPAALIITPELEWLKGLGVQEKNYITDLIGRKEKLVLKISEGKMDFKQEDGKLLSEILHGQGKATKEDVTRVAKQEAPKVKEEPIPSTSQREDTKTVNKRVLLDDMDYIQVDPGTHEFVCYTWKSAADINLVLQRDDIIEHMELLVGLKVDDSKPYKPDEGEMCLAYNEGEGLWERAVVLTVIDDNYEVSSVDFGTNLTLKLDKIRSFPAYLTDVPILGIPCELKGIPDTPVVNKLLKEIIVEGQNLRANVIKFDESTFKYQIEYEPVTKKMKSEGII